MNRPTPTAAAKPQAVPPDPALPNALETLNLLAEQNRPKAWIRAFVAGRPGTGKTHLILSAPRPSITLYCDRANGDVDLEKEAKNGVYRIYLRRGQVSITEQMIKQLERIESGDLSGYGIQTVCLDSLSYLQALVQNECVTGGKQASQRDFGKVVQQMERALLNLLTMEKHVLILAHLKSKVEPVQADNGDQLRQTIWMPDAMPRVREIIAKEAGLMGYTWRRTDAEGVNTFGVNFTEASRSRGMFWQFQDAKAPAGWGSNEPADLSAWIARLAAPVIPTSDGGAA